MNIDIHTMMVEALQASNPAQALRELVEELKTNGLTQRAIFEIFSMKQQALTGKEPAYDALVDTMDLIQSGPWAKGRGLFETELRDNA